MTEALVMDEARARRLRAQRMAHAALTSLPLLAMLACMHLLGMISGRAALALAVLGIVHAAGFLYFVFGGTIRARHDGLFTATATCTTTVVILLVAFSATPAGRTLPLLVVPMIFAFASYRYGRAQLVRLAIVITTLVAIEQAAAARWRPESIDAGTAMLETAMLAVVLMTLAVIGGQANDYRRRTYVDRAMAGRALAQMHDAVIALDQDGRTRSLNAAAAELFELSRDRALGEPVDALVRVEEPDGQRGLLEALRGHADVQATAVRAHPAVAVTPSGRRVEIDVSISALAASDGTPVGHVLVARDVGHTNRLIRELRHSATHDALTGLKNRRGFFEDLRGLLRAGDRAERDDGELYVLVIDLDDFKIVNDTAGHRAGDEVLRAVADMIEAQFPAASTRARIGGDEFGLVVRERGLAACQARAAGLLQVLSTYRLARGSRVFRVAASIGIARPERGLGAQAAVAQADAACFLAKELGRGRVQVFRSGDEDIARRQRDAGWVSRLQDALEQDRFVLFGQRIAPAHGERPDARGYYELLLRLRTQDGRIVSPDAFLPAAERFHQMAAIDRWVVRKAIAHARDWPGGPERCPRLAVNLSASSLSDPTLIDEIGTWLAEAGVDGRRFVFELTESAALLDLQKAHAFVTRLQALRCRVALDDVGAGFSSLSHLRSLPVDQIKIDGSFVRTVRANALDRVLVESLQRVADVLGVQTVAEYVEDGGIAAVMREIGVTYLQGWGVHRPQPLDEIQREIQREARPEALPATAPA